MATNRTRRGKPEPTPPPARLLQYLESEQAIRLLDPALRSGRTRALHKQRTKLVKTAPSGAWFDACWQHGQDMPEGFTRCGCCGRLTPASGLSMARTRGVCDDCCVDGSDLEEQGEPGQAERYRRLNDAFGPSPLLAARIHGERYGGRVLGEYHP